MIWINVERRDCLQQRARHWPGNLERDPRVTLTLLNESNPYEYAELKGTVVEVDAGSDADKHMDTLAQKYLNQDTYPWRQAGEVRVKFHLAPAKIRHVRA